SVVAGARSRNQSQGSPRKNEQPDSRNQFALWPISTRARAAPRRRQRQLARDDNADPKDGLPHPEFIPVSEFMSREAKQICFLGQVLSKALADILIIDKLAVAAAEIAHSDRWIPLRDSNGAGRYRHECDPWARGCRNPRLGQ